MSERKARGEDRLVSLDDLVHPDSAQCPQCGGADLEQRGGKHVCPACGFIQPCCNP
jgi:transposase